MSIDQRVKMMILMINMFIAVGSFGIIISILLAYILSIGQGGTAAYLLFDVHISYPFILGLIVLVMTMGEMEWHQKDRYMNML